MSLVVNTVNGQITLASDTLNDGSTIQKLYVAPARKTGVGPAEKLNVTSGSIVTLTPPATATHAVLSNETNPIRIYDTGDTPTTGASGNGHELVAGTFYEIDAGSFAQFKMIAVGSSSTVHVTYYRY